MFHHSRFKGYEPLNNLVNRDTDNALPIHTIALDRDLVNSRNSKVDDNNNIVSEEKEIIIPAVNELRENGVLAFGPFPSDGFFGSKSRDGYDGVLSMYHDQGLTVFKALSFDEGVNYSSGIPIVRTSPDHGTAYDIAGKGVASETSMRNAIYMALDIYTSRMTHKELNNNPIITKKEKQTHKEDRKNKGLKKN